MRKILKNLIAAITLKLRNYPETQNVFVRIVSTFVSPPCLQDNMETTIGPYEGASCASCTDGRQIGENNTNPRYYLKVHYDTEVLDLTGSRSGCPINVSALQSVLKHWLEAIEIIDYVRTQQIKRLALQSGPLSYFDLMILGQICIAIPAYLLRRARSPIGSSSIPAPLGAAYKLIAGLPKIVGRMVAQGEKCLWTENPPTATGLYAYAEENGLLIGPDGNACAGSERMLIKLLDLTVNGQQTLGNAANRDQEFFRLIGGGSDWIEYGLDCAAVKLAYSLFRAELECEALKIKAHRFDLNKSELAVLKDILAMLPKPTRASHIGGEAVENRRTALNEMVRKITSKDLLQEIEDRVQDSQAQCLNFQRVLTGSTPEIQIFIQNILNRYLSILQCADEFSFEQQQKINRLLGRMKSARLSVDALTAKLGGAVQPKSIGLLRISPKYSQNDSSIIEPGILHFN